LGVDYRGRTKSKSNVTLEAHGKDLEHFCPDGFLNGLGHALGGNGGAESEDAPPPPSRGTIGVISMGLAAIPAIGLTLLGLKLVLALL
jgi:hypothetical protein